MTKLEKAALRQVIANGKPPSVPGAKVPDPDHPDHWIAAGTSIEDVNKLVNSPNFRKGWALGWNYFADALGRIMDMTPAQLRTFTGTDKQIKT